MLNLRRSRWTARGRSVVPARPALRTLSRGGPPPGPVVPARPPNAGGTDEHTALEELAGAYADYRTAHRLRNVDEAAEHELVRARVHLYRALLATHWVPPSHLAGLLARDDALVDVTDSALALALLPHQEARAARSASTGPEAAQHPAVL